MRITLLCIGATDKAELKSLIAFYGKRLGHYVKYDLMELPDIKNTKNLSENQQKEKEAELLLKAIDPTDHIVLLDEHGTSHSSVGFSTFLQKHMNSGKKRLVFIIGGPYGFSEQIVTRAQQKLSLSAMTFSHQMVRLFFVEQLYRAFTILKNEPYHHR
ncbi:23S rRNA (pseudouridine(1915)-N(3))-methyltransferase RlmH [Flagellimonas sp. DF-77]|uniref:23S rRNA (pseudouridine(1915)-N(3))-methyltransferase RlmH n=1 Tax=Flagellimonas algarum TaxID=3230298 RepID=UPI003398B1CF